jgi:hypothetical protein
MVDAPALFQTAFLSALKEAVHPHAFNAGSNEQQGECNGKNGMRFDGSYKSIAITDCQNVRLHNIKAESVRLLRSSAIFDGGSITGSTVGLQVEDSTITANGLRVAAQVAVSASNSRLDLAGVHLKGSRSAVTTDSRATLLFSVSRIQSPHGSGTIHGLRNLLVGEAL